MRNLIKEWLQNEWYIKEELTVGSCHSRVFKVTKEGDISVVKVYRLKYDERYDKLKTIYLKEIKYMEKLNNSPNIIHIEKCEKIKGFDQELGEDVDYILIKMQYKECLGKAIQDGKKMEFNDVVHFAKNISAAIIACNKVRIMHRDIKPFNIFFDEDNFWLSDMGTAIEFNDNDYYEPVGTPLYAAPEILKKSWTYNQTVDIYSLGIIMYELLNENKVPFVSNDGTIADYREAIKKRCRGDYFPPLRGKAQLMYPIISRCCEYDSIKRFQSAEELLIELEKF